MSANSTVAQVTVNQSIVVANNGTKTDASCNGTATGSVTLGTISGGNGSYSISWTGPGGYTGSGSTISNLAAGTYIYSVSGGVCAAASASIIITEPGLLNAVVSATEVSCFGLDDGTITIDNPTGGYGMFEYTINGGGNWQSSGNYTGLMPGTYNVRIRDAQHTSCVRTLYSVLQIGEPDAVVLTTTSTNVTCNGAANGTITASASGGTSGSPVITVNGQPYNPNATYAPGMYTVVATDDDANYTGVCTDTKIINIMEPSAISGSGAITSDYNGSDLSCATATDGEITITATGGTGTLMYSIDGGTYQASNVFIGLAAGTHTLSVQDANGCTFAATSVTITAPAAISGSGAITSDYNGSDLSCATATDGEITITATGGTGTLMYSIDGGTYQASNVFIGLAAGTHTLSVQDANGCTFAAASVTITAPAAISGSGAITSDYNGSDLSCATATDGEITITATGGTGTLMYSIDGGTYQASNVFIGLAAGTHTLSVQDANGCTFAAASVTITAPAAISGSGAITSDYNGSDLSCATATDGEITITATGGTGTLMYSIDGGTYQASNVFIGLAAGTHTLSVQDANGCTFAAASVTITAPAAISGSGAITSDYNGSDLSCATATDGEITITATGGTGTLMYSIDGGTYQASNVFIGLAAGTHTLSVQDANGCTFAAASVTITAPAAISGSGAITSDYNGSDLSCATATDGEITITATGGTGTLMYSIDGGTYQASNVFIGLAAGTHTLSVQDANGCTFAAASVTITAPAAISGSGAITSDYNGSDLSCATATDGEITITATGGTGTLMYSIDGGTYQASNVFIGLAAGTHTLSVQDANGCTFAAASVTITAPAAISGSGAITSDYNGSDLSCATATDGEITITATGGTGTLMYSIDGGTYQASNVFIGLAAGTHTLSVQDANGCTFAAASVTITAPAAISGSGAITSDYNGSDLSCATATDGEITITATGGTGTLMYSIDGGTYQASNVFIGLAAGTHTLSVQDANGCTFAAASVTITAPAAISGSGAITSDYNGSDLSCATATDGEITITATGGTGTLMYSIDGGTYQASNVFIGVAAGTHTLSVQDANGCTFAAASVTITAPTAITGGGAVTSNYNGSQVSCNGSANGTITVTAGGGTGQLSYTLSGGTLTTPATNATGIFSGLGAGAYHYSVTDENNCNAAEGDVTIDQPAAITGSGAVTSNYNGSQVSCNGSADGTITVTAGGEQDN